MTTVPSAPDAEFDLFAIVFTLYLGDNIIDPGFSASCNRGDSVSAQLDCLRLHVVARWQIELALVNTLAPIACLDQFANRPALVSVEDKGKDFPLSLGALVSRCHGVTV